MSRSGESNLFCKGLVWVQVFSPNKQTLIQSNQPHSLMLQPWYANAGMDLAHPAP